jgi:hypothetical protein
MKLFRYVVLFFLIGGIAWSVGASGSLDKNENGYVFNFNKVNTNQIDTKIDPSPMQQTNNDENTPLPVIDLHPVPVLDQVSEVPSSTPQP